MMHRGRRLLLFLLFFLSVGSRTGPLHVGVVHFLQLASSIFFLFLFYSSSSCLFTLYFFLCLCSETFLVREIMAQTSL